MLPFLCPRPTASVNAALVALAILGAARAHGQSDPAPQRRPLTYEALYGRDRVDFDGSYERPIGWLPDGQSYLRRQGGQLQRVYAASGDVAPAYDSERLAVALRGHPLIDEEHLPRILNWPVDHLPSFTELVVEDQQRLFYFSFPQGRLLPLTPRQAARGQISLSPDGHFAAYVEGNDLYTVSTRDAKTTRHTHDGSRDIFNGALDWVYMEELYGRGNRRGYWWSPAGDELALLRLDDRSVPEFPLVNALPLHAELEREHYPKPGDPNPLVALGVVRPGDDDPPRWVDLSHYAARGEDILIVQVGWLRDELLYFLVQDRAQTWLDFNVYDTDTGRTARWFRERGVAWIELVAPPLVLADDSFLWVSGRDGFRHIYHYRFGGSLRQRITRGAWDVRDLLGVDDAGEHVWFTGTADKRNEAHLYRAAIDADDPPQRLTEPGFSHSILLSPRADRYIDTFSNLTTPPRVTLNDAASGATTRVISANEVTVLDEYDLAEPRWLEVPMRDGYRAPGILLVPSDFTPGQPRPVWCYVYGGPNASITANRWGGGGALQRQLIAARPPYPLVWVFDPRSACDHGAVSAWQAYRHLGEQELADLEDSLAWLANEGYIDPQRIGIEGASYGGFFTSYALTHSDGFKLGFAISSVTDWRLYDSIYTERYMGTPGANLDGYVSTSVVEAAEHLTGHMLIVHGLIDDNVHFQNSVRLIERLQSLKREFELMVYPLDRHGIWRGGEHLRQLRLRRIEDGL